jgi:uncharacterized protein
VSSSPERFDLRHITPQPWKNGAGITREIAVGPKAGGATEFDWRLSVAEVDRDAPFSAFPGIDRCIVLLRGAGMHLHSTDGRVNHRLDRPLAAFQFSGDVPLEATLIDGPSSDFNVMTRRGLWSCELSVHHASFEMTGADVTLLLCCEGEWQVTRDTSEILGPMQALLWRAPSPRIVASPRQTGALLLVRLCHDRTP